jgi:hypothetical protein
VGSQAFAGELDPVKHYTSDPDFVAVPDQPVNSGDNKAVSRQSEQRHVGYYQMRQASWAKLKVSLYPPPFLLVAGIRGGAGPCQALHQRP